MCSVVVVIRVIYDEACVHSRLHGLRVCRRNAFQSGCKTKKIKIKIRQEKWMSKRSRPISTWPWWKRCNDVTLGRTVSRATGTTGWLLGACGILIVIVTIISQIVVTAYVCYYYGHDGNRSDFKATAVRSGVPFRHILTFWLTFFHLMDRDVVNKSKIIRSHK